MLNLSAAMVCVTLNRRIEATAYLDEAERIAARTGEGNAFGLHFGPTNVKVWQVALQVELGDATAAVQVAGTVNPDLIDSKGRQATFHSDWGRALAKLKGREREAVTKIRQAEKLAPEQIRNNPLVRETVAHLLRPAHGRLPAPLARDLRGLAYRMGIA